MNNTLLWLFIGLNVANVIIQTIKSIATIKCKPVSAAIINAVAYGLYTVVLVYMVCDLPLWAKVAVVGGANLIGVYLVKIFEEKGRKDKLWKVEVTVPTCSANQVHEELLEIPHSYIEFSPKHTLFNFYCATQADSKKVKEIVNQYGAKYFVAESKIL
jgi:hypothetical protein